MQRIPRTALSLVAITVAIRVALIFRYRFDSDEPQHMHVAWGWAHGLKQYRDVFDNHMPLFHLLSAPLFAATGDDPRLLFAARLSMLPLFFASIALVWFIARRLFDETTAWGAAILAAVVPPFFLGSLEYRTDDLWIVLWLAVILVAVSNLSLAKKAAYGGLLLGAAFGVSMKSSLFVIVVVIAGVATLLLTLRRAPLPSVRMLLTGALIAGATTAIIPLLIAGGFAAAGLWRPFVYGVFEHNRFPFEHAGKMLLVIPMYPVIRYIALRIARSDGDPRLVRRRLFVFLACSVYLVLLAFWPMVALETYLPFYPLAALLAAPLLMRRQLLVPALATAMLFAVVLAAQPWRNEAQEEIALVDEVLLLTAPNDPVMDLKGETVFRARPYYYVLEAITNVKMRMGIIRDQIADTLVRTRTYVVAADNLPPAAQRFVNRYYVHWGAVHVAGVRVRPPQEAVPVDFEIGIDGPYVVMGDRGLLHAAIDGTRVTRAGVMLRAGRHRLVTFERATDAVVVWSGTLRGKN